MTEGTRGGSVNRPGARAEIQKFARSVCDRCKMDGCAPMVVNNRCTNTAACDKRRRKWERDNPAPPPPPRPRGAPTPAETGCQCAACVNARAKR